jgi:hypothetical protein
MEKRQIITPYESVPYIPLNEVELESRHGAHFFSNVKQISVGFGSRVFRVDRDGMWAGAETYAAAPWKVDWDGNMVASSITISGYVATGGALADIGAGNITETYIGSNAISASKIQANAITASKIQAGAIDGITITGSLVRTSSGNDRVQLNESTNALEVYSGGNKRVVLDNDEITFFNSSEVERGGITANTTEIYFTALNGGNLHLEAEGSAYTIIFTVNNDQKGYFSNSGLTLDDDLNLNGNEILNVQEITFEKRTASSNTDGEILHYDNGSTQEWRTQMDGTDYTFDLSFA